MTPTRAKSAADTDSTFTNLIRRLNDEERAILRQLDDQRGMAIVATEERVLEIAGRLCNQYGHPELFELIYLATHVELAPKVGEGARWLAERTA
jgi:hypothetical protein